MKKQSFLYLLPFLLLPYLSNSQNFYLDSDCSFDTVKSSENLEDEINYMKFNLHYGGKEIPKKMYFKDISWNFGIVSTLRIFKNDVDTDFCPWTAGDNTGGDTKFKGETSTMLVELVKNNQVIDVIVDNATFNNNESTDLLINMIKSYKTPPSNLPMGAGYKVRYTLNVNDYPNYFDPFDLTITTNTSDFTLGDGSDIIYPKNEEVITNSQPIIKWEKLAPTTEYRAVVYEITVPVTFSWSSKTGEVTGAIFDSNYQTDLNTTIPENILKTNTNYGILIINRINGFLFGKASTFKTASTLSNLDLEYQKNITISPNPATDIINIALNNNTALKEISINDLQGRLVKRKTQSDLNNINISEFSKGVYFLKLVNTKNKKAVFKIIKK